ncbi:midasin-like isoform X2 [Diachasmimorpha longicaudata]
MLRDNFAKYIENNSHLKTCEQFRNFIDKAEFTENDRQQLLELLSDRLINEASSTIVVNFPQFFPIMLSMTIPLEPSELSTRQRSTLPHEKKCILLSEWLNHHPDVLGYTLRYFETHPAPFESVTENPKFVNKRPKIQRKACTPVNKPKEPSDHDIVKATYKILLASPPHFKRKWNWSNFYRYLDHKNDEVRFIVIKCLGIVLEMSEMRTMSWIKSSIPHYANSMPKFALGSRVNSPVLLTEDYDLKEVEECLDDTNLVSIAGVLLPALKKNDPTSLSLITVPSMESNLRNLALAVASRQAVCLQGPVGCGKSALVEYLAQITGRGQSDIIKVQLGDQTDSKMLLGMYRCTDIPGEFVWQPGVLTQAVLSGKWLLLEDIDSAALDVASVLNSLMETGSLSVPGYRDTVYVKSGFQLFVTQRLITTMTGAFKQSSGASGLMENHWLCVHMEPLSKEELITVVQTLFPVLSTIATKIVNVFLLFSSGNHEAGSENLSRAAGRLISTRDLIKWCTRAIVDFKVSSPESALKVLQDAIDIFCCSVPDVALRLELAVSIGNTLGIISTKAEYFVNSHKPSISIQPETFGAGRAKINRKSARSVQLDDTKVKFSFTRPSASLLERITSCVAHKEPVLLVGETGTGKTSSVQFLARKTGHKLIVINMNQQSESADLLGGYKPVDIRLLVTPIREEFEILFRSFFAIEPNRKFLDHVAICYRDGKWKTLVSLMSHSTRAGIERLLNGKHSSSSSSRKRIQEGSKTISQQDAELLIKWEKLLTKLQKLKSQVKAELSLAFAFIEGSLVKALQDGHWVLLDEINLASSETLECLSGLLEGSSGSISLLERGDNESVKRHPDFTMFACMNPATDVGKKELPVGLRNRFTEFYVDELTERSDLQLLVSSYLDDLNIPSVKVEAIVKLYLTVRNEAMQSLNDGTGHKPHFSLRTLCRALSVAAKNPCGNVLRSLYEAFCLSFLTQLDQNSYPVVHRLITQTILDQKTMKGTLGAPIPKPKCGRDEDYINFEGYWVVKGSLEPEIPENYILTSSVRRNLKDLVRVVSIGKMPVLLQGDTSVGKTSLITYLAKASGHVCVRINNHEHTDLQEYVGSYVASETGKLVFKEGVLVEAMRKGYWIILDELNLAPSDVLEALNRVLDDNRELFIPETQQIVKAHSNFMLFATQNPPGIYGGRKVLSRAFRNRFVELHFDEIPPAELQVILHERCQMPESYCKQIIDVMTDLQMRRKSTAAFSGKHGFITLRDLFRWGERFRLAENNEKGFYDWSQHMADEGYLVLAAKIRKPEEAEEIRQVIRNRLKRDVDPGNLFSLSDKTSTVTKPILEAILNKTIPGFEHIVWTYHMRRMAVLVIKSCQFKEPVLLVGETGGGKTTVCQLAAAMKNKHLWSVNCHMHTESSDFLGNLRPVRDHSDDNQKLFEWVDGPLITAMRAGDIFLADEISLADDSVLERMNSLLEPERSLLLAEKSTDSNTTSNELDSVITAHEDFCFVGTMNPGGDYGKKELSPALRNRFTEIWCEGCTDNSDLQLIVEHNLRSRPHVDNQTIATAMMIFLDWLKSSEVGKRFSVSIRDVLTWVDFMNSSSTLSTSEAYYHGACLTYIDSLGSGVTGTESYEKLESFRITAINFLRHQTRENFETQEENMMATDPELKSDELFGVAPFYIPVGPSGKLDDIGFTFTAPTTGGNALKVLRALQLKKPLLLEGSPGVGKTSLISAIAKASGHSLLRINLSDQTDVSDLFGADLPLEGGKGGQFAWKDGPFLRALRAGDWILLDELNLASQSVLEGLNACLDHRGEVYIPELGKTFTVKRGTKLFGCQNPLRQGGARRGLPKSFLNRFTQVFVDALSDDDLNIITQCQFPELGEDLVRKIVELNSKVSSQAGHTWGHYGAPWELNLRDITRLCELINSYKTNSSLDKCLFEGVALIYCSRLRSPHDKDEVSKICEKVFGRDEYQILRQPKMPILNVTDEHLYFDNVIVERTDKAHFEDRNLLILRSHMSVLKGLAYCVNMNWMPILVGPSGVGKSCVVRVLSQLCGQKLRSIVVNSAMDTTEILGGFEQTDYNRHLEQLIAVTEDLVIRSITENLESNRKEVFADLHGQLELVKGLSTGDDLPRTMADEIELFLQRIEKLLKLTSTIRGLRSTENSGLTELETKLENLAAVVKEEKCLNAGGKFEWIDSVLVKCLRDGTWLLVDQVNLCSPAVLDRLNGLLEPNGVLTIGERGTDSSGNVHTIKPHPNFRLFLTMDPNYGEISRAMRNRGVEIYLSPRRDDPESNTLDIKSQLYALGLVRVNHQNALIDINRKISSENLGGKPIVGDNELLQAAFLIAQQVNRGFPVNNAFKMSCIDVYIKSRSIHDSIIKQTLIQLIDSSIAFHKLIEAGPSCLEYSEITPNIQDFLADARTCLLKQQSTNLQAISNKYNDWCKTSHTDKLLIDFLDENYFSTILSPIQIDYPVAEQVFLHFLVNFLERSSVEDFQWRIDFLENRLSRSIFDRYKHLSDKCKQLKSIVDDASNGFPSRSLPWHPLSSVCEFTPDQYQLALKISLINYIKIHLVEADTPSGGNRAYTKVTVQEFSQIPANTLVPHGAHLALINMFSPVAETISKWMQTYILEAIGDFNYNSWLNFRRNLIGLKRFYDQGKQIVFDKDDNSNDTTDRIDFITRNLHVHYEWVLKFVEESLEKSKNVTNKNVERMSKIMYDLTTELGPFLPRDNDCYRKFAKDLREHMKFPPPYKSVEIIAMHNQYQRIITELSPLGDTVSPSSFAWKLRLMIIEMKECIALRESLIRTWQNIWIGQNPEETTDVISAVENVTDHKLSLNTHEKMSQTLDYVLSNRTAKELNESVMKIQLLPIHEYLFILLANKLHQIACDKMINLPTQPVHRDRFLQFTRIPSLPINLIAVLDAVHMTENKTDNSLVYELFYQLNNFKNTSLAFRTPGAVLNFPGVSRSDADMIETPDGDGENDLYSLQQPTLILLLSNLIGSKADTNRDTSIMKTVSLGSCTEKTRQLKLLNDTVWHNSLALSSKEYEFLSMDLKVLKAHLAHYVEVVEKIGTELTITENTSPSRVDRYTFQMRNRVGFYDPLLKFKRYITCPSTFAPENFSIAELGITWAQLGFHQLFLFLHIDIIDPMKRLDIKIQFITDCIVDLENMIYSLDMDAVVLGDDTVKIRDPRVLEARKALDKLHIEKGELLQRRGFRAPTANYLSLRQKLQTVQDLLNSPHAYFQSIQDLHSMLLAGSPLEDRSMAIWQSSIDAVKEKYIFLRDFSSKLRDEFLANFRDIIQPILISVAHLQHGMKILIDESTRWVAENRSKFNWSMTAESFLHNIVRFPTVGREQENLLHLIDLHSGIGTTKFVNSKIDELKLGAELATIEVFRRLKNSLSELYNYTSLNGRVTPQIWQVLNQLSLQIDLFRRKEEVFKKQIKEEKEGYYRFTGQATREVSTEEEEINLELRRLFPMHRDDDFREIDDSQPTLEARVSTDEDPEDCNHVSVCDGTMIVENVIIDEDIYEVYEIYSKLVQHFVKARWLETRGDTPQRDYIEPLLERFRIFNTILPSAQTCLSSGLTSKLYMSFNILTSVAACDSRGEVFFKESSFHKKPYNFYKSKNIAEVQTCLPILDTILHRVNDLLKQWPEHPTLSSIHIIITRIHSFPVHSPISRFLTGLELLLVKMREWEENAHSGVSLIEQSTSLTQQIIEWRKLELNCWKTLLESVFERLKTKAAKWWLLLFNVVQSYLNKSSETPSPPEESAETENEEILTAKILIEQLENFMNQSPLVEFQARLELLYTFHCYICCAEPSSEKDELLAIFWNIHHYYGQFSKEVEAKINSLKSPIEKKLKEFVKIARWNDINYWSVKETVEKTHRTLFKFVKEYENGLMQNVGACLVVKPSNYDLEANRGEWDRSRDRDYTIDPMDYIIPSLPKVSITLQVPNDLINRSASLLMKSRELCKQTITKSMYPPLRLELEQFIEDSMTHAISLKNMEVDRTLPLSKQKSHAKSILQQKKMALADYFKSLNSFGMSYRKGLLALKNRPEDINNFTVPPVEVSSALKKFDTLKRIDQQMLAQWADCQSYYYKSLIKLNALNSAFMKVQTDLGVSNMERCSGYSNHLMLLIHNEKKILAENFDTFIIFKERIAQLMRIDTEDIALPVYQDMSTCSNQLKDLLLFLQINFEQLVIYLHSCPSNDGIEGDSEVLLVESSNIPIVNSKKDDDVWSSAISMLTSCSDIVSEELKKHVKMFGQSSHSVIRTAIHYNSLGISQQSLQKIRDTISHFLKLFSEDHPIMETIQYIETKIEAWSVSFTELELIPNTEVSPSNFRITEFSDAAEALIKTVLFIIQEKYKETSSSETDGAPDGDVAVQKTKDVEEVSDSQLLENGLREKLIESLEKDITTLRLNELNDKLEKLIELSQTVTPSFSSQSNLIWRRCLPILNQYLQLSQFYLHEQVALFRTSCKFLYIQLNVFLDLATNGFCVPKDLDLGDAEADENGEQRDSDKGGMGLADGEGKKDVSDRLESEDQLDEARPAGEEKDSKEDKDCKEEENGIDMSENFDSKLQDLDKEDNEEDDDNEKDEDDEDLDKEMGDTENGTDQLDKEIWGDEEEEQETETNDTDEQGAGEQLGDKEMTAKDEKTKNSNEEDQNQRENREGDDEEKEEINEMNEPDVNDDQINPYHGNQEPQPEPEALDLPEDLNLDDGEGKEDNAEGEENPFDIDEMKESMPPPEVKEPEAPQEEEKKDNAQDNDSSDEDENGPSTSDPEVKDLDENEQNPEEGSNQAPEQSSKDEEPTPEETEKSSEEQVAPSMDDASEETDAAQESKTKDGSHDKVPDKENKNEEQESSAAENNQDNGEDQGTGQAETEEPEHGHVGTSSQKNTPVQRQQMERTPQEKRKNPGESDENHALMDNIQRDKKKQKMISSREESSADKEDDEGAEGDKDEDVDMCEHVKESEKYDSYATDAATEEQAKNQATAETEENSEEKDEEDEMNVDMHEDKPVEADELQKMTQNPEETPESDDKKDKKSKTSSKGQVLEESSMETQVEVEGENVDTFGVQRAAESAFYTNLIEDSSMMTIEDRRQEIESMLSQWRSTPTTEQAMAAWNSLCAVTEGSARDLSEKLRLVLEPTQATRLRGDYRTGKRINMRKIIPYIASQFRKDKIWMRRTKPSKRDYQIVLALDDSSSMSDNHSKELAFESLSLISKAMGYLEVGELGVLSFGETPKVLHPLGAPFTEESGSRLIQDMKFDQKNTKIAELVHFTVDMFEEHRTATDNAKLLLILSDGRGLSSDGLNKVIRAVRRAKLKDIFIVFIIVENPNSRDSILDIRNAVFEGGKVVFYPYLDSFPFPFYMILKDINALPGVLSDALRQWFEVVGKIDS